MLHAWLICWDSGAGGQKSEVRGQKSEIRDQTSEVRVKVFTLQEAEASRDIDIKMMATRSSRYRVFGSSERIQHGEMAVVDLRDGIEPSDFSTVYHVLERHPMKAVCLVRTVP